MDIGPTFKALTLDLVNEYRDARIAAKFLLHSSWARLLGYRAAPGSATTPAGPVHTSGDPHRMYEEPVNAYGDPWVLGRATAFTQWLQAQDELDPPLVALT